MYKQSFKKKKSTSTPIKQNRKRFKQPANHRKGKQKSTLDPTLLVRKATVQSTQPYEASREITDLPLHQNLIQRLLDKGFARPSEIQDKTLEFLLEGHDLLGIAQTGTGKTAAFLVPIIQQLIENKRHHFALIVVPTRELATQVQSEFKSMTAGLNLYSGSFIGGGNVNKDMQVLKRPHHLIVATPGRLLDLVGRKAIDLSRFNTLVLDEFDRMLDMGFVHDVKRIIKDMHRRKQSMLFSATLDKTQEKLIDEILRNPKVVKVSNGNTTSNHIDQDIIRLEAGQDKFDVLLKLITDKTIHKVLLFEETKRRVSRLCDKLNKAGLKSEQIHGSKSQNARQRALDSFKRGHVKVLVATDVAARGIDVSDVTHVVNYQVPLTYDSYIHRIGRTGRAGKTGKAFTFVD